MLSGTAALIKGDAHQTQKGGAGADETDQQGGIRQQYSGQILPDFGKTDHGAFPLVVAGVAKGPNSFK